MTGPYSIHFNFYGKEYKIHKISHLVILETNLFIYEYHPPLSLGILRRISNERTRSMRHPSERDMLGMHRH